MKGSNHYMWKGVVGVSHRLSLSACCECNGKLCLQCVRFSCPLVCHHFSSSFPPKIKKQNCISPFRSCYVIIKMNYNASLLCKSLPRRNLYKDGDVVCTVIFVFGCSACSFLFFSFSCSLAMWLFLLHSLSWLWSAFEFAGVSEFLTASHECVFWKSYSTFGATIIGTKPLRWCRRVCGFTHLGPKKCCAISF